MIIWRDRFRAAGLHFGISLLVAASAALLVFRLWYPYPYDEISGGRELFTLLVIVDVIVGPLITLSVFDRAKPRRELVRDLGVVAFLQLAALAYGLWTVMLARPVHLVFEIDRFRVVHAVDVPPELLDTTNYTLPLAGPTLLSVRPFRDEQERMQATMLALQGLHLGARPDLWQPYESGRAAVLRNARPVSVLQIRFPERANEIAQQLQAAGRHPETMSYLPLAGRKSFWTVFVDPASAQIVGFMPLDPY